MYKVCIFDLDGTLTNTLESITYSVNKTLDKLGLTNITMEQCRQFVGDGARVLMERTLQAVGDTKLERIESAMEVYGSVFGKNCTYHVMAYEGIMDMLEELEERGIKLAILSNKPHQQSIDVVARILGKHRFSCVNGQREGIEKKPDPAGVFQIMKCLQVTKEECLYIGDSEVDVETARRAGVTSIGVSWGFRSKEVLQNAGADYIIDRPCELLKFV
ncbi:HAD family hydrolase [Faecalimonas sp.]